MRQRNERHHPHQVASEQIDPAPIPTAPGLYRPGESRGDQRQSEQQYPTGRDDAIETAIRQVVGTGRRCVARR